MEQIPSPLRAALPLAGRALEAVLDRLLALDPETRSALVRLEGRRIELRLASPPLALSLQVTQGRLKVGPADTQGEPDLSLQATLGAVLGRLLPGAAGPGPAGQMRISGDAELARQMQKLASSYQPDIEGAFSSLFGEVLGVQIAHGLRDGLKQARDLGGQAARGAVDYLVEERRDLVSRAEQEALFDDIDDLRDAVERIEARIGRLEPAGSRR